MKEKDTKKKKRIDIDLIKSDITDYQVGESGDYYLSLKLEEKKDIDQTITFTFTMADIKADLHIRAALFADAKVKLMVIIKTPAGVKNVSSVLDMRALLLSEFASIEFVPSLEIDEMNVSVDHKSTIGVPDQKELEYLQSRGMSKKKAIDMIADSFFE